MKQKLKEYCGHHIRLEEVKKDIKELGYSKELHDELFYNVHAIKAVSTALGHEMLSQDIHRFEDYLLKIHSFNEMSQRSVLVQLDRINFKVKRRLNQEDIHLESYFETLVENVCKLVSKSVNFKYQFQGSESSLKEKHLMRELISPILLNSIDHTIEFTEDRHSVGKVSKLSLIHI